MQFQTGLVARATAVVLGLAFGAGAMAQGQPDAAQLMAAQREAMKPLAFMNGIWRGPAWTMLPSGEKRHLTQTERIGPMLDGSIKVIEGKGYEADGRPSFNAFATISYDTEKKSYRFHSYAMGRVGDFVLTPTADGYVWEIPAGPQMTIRYTAVVKGDDFFEYGDRVVTGQEPVRFFEMRLKRLGETTWPAGDAVPPAFQRVNPRTVFGARSSIVGAPSPCAR
ncbi:MAG: hypothetical protein Q7T55_11105, partial [Solirubrobacteraceae bacterium]|nr:hypothetical protein [Solirubrobacteraceae bacterium]